MGHEDYVRGIIRLLLCCELQGKTTGVAESVGSGTTLQAGEWPVGLTVLSPGETDAPPIVLQNSDIVA